MIKEQYIEKLNNIIIDILKTEGINDPVLVAEIPPEASMGDVAYPMFRFSKELKKSPPQIANLIQKKLDNSEDIDKTEVKGPYLNVFFNRKKLSKEIIENALHLGLEIGNQAVKNEKVLIEFSCPNTNKPLHLGHCRNNILGDSMARIYKKAGFEVNKVNLINDRGIHICKSMLAYKYFGNGVTPESSGKKSDHLVGDFYVRYSVESQKNPALEKEAQQMLIAWENKDKDVLELWQTMNDWAVGGIKKTYKRMGIEFDNYQFESDTYVFGKDIINEGLTGNVFYKEEDGSVWVNNEDVGLDKKIVLRSDGTSIYITQDIGTAAKRSELFGFDKMVYVVGSEQIYHFQTLFAIFKKLGYSWADNCYHLSYGMVNLPDGRMKSREGNVIDADNLMDLLYDMSYKVIEEKHEDWSVVDKEMTANKVSLGALKYYLLNFTTTKDIMFIPEKSISFDGNTGPYLQYVTARINSLIIKSGIDVSALSIPEVYDFVDTEWFVISKIADFDNSINKAASEYSPMEISAYLYDLARLYNKLYHDLPILNADNEDSKTVRLVITYIVLNTLKSGLYLLGIDFLEKM